MMHATLAAMSIVLATAPAASPGAPTIGSVAQGVLDPRVPGVVETWRAALKDSRPELRAAAARAVNASGLRNLGPEIVEALQVEGEEGVRRELLAAAVVVRPASEDALLVAAVRSPLEASTLANSLLRSRGGPSAALHLEGLRQRGFKPSPRYLEPLLAENGLRERLARTALESADGQLWSAVLSAGEREQPLLGEGLLMDALGAPSSELRQKTLWYLARRVTDAGPRTAGLLSAVAGSVPAPDAPLQERLARELASRALGQSPREVSGWIASLKAKEPLLPELDFRDHSGDRLLTKNERKALQDVARFGLRPAPSGKVPAMWVLSGFPAGYRDAILESTGCKAGREILGGVEILFKPDGRARSIGVMPDLLDKACQDAVRTLAASSLVPAHDPVPGEAVLLFVILDPEFLACEAEQSVQASPVPAGGTAKITTPTKIKSVPPVYPEAAKRNGVQGLVMLQAVIAASGCVQQLKVIHTDHAGLAWPAMRAVSQWRYSPTLLDGVAVPVVMTVTVNFTLSYPRPIGRGD
jgi:TonB family protein